MDDTIKRILGEALPPYRDEDAVDPEEVESDRRYELERRMVKVLQAGFHIAGLEIAVDEHYPVSYEASTNEADVKIEVGSGVSLSSLNRLRESGLAEGDYMIEPVSNGMCLVIRFQMAKELVTGKVKPLTGG